MPSEAGHDVVAEEIDEQQFTMGEGPCLDAFLHDRVESIDDIAAGDGGSRWPLFTAAVDHLDIGGVHAWPLRANNHAFGALELYSTHTRPIDDRTRSVVHDRADRIAADVAAELAPTRNPSIPVDDRSFSRGNVHLATGMLSVQLDVSVAEALTRLRAHAFAHNTRITTLARDIVERRRHMEPDEL